MCANLESHLRFTTLYDSRVHDITTQKIYPAITSSSFSSKFRKYSTNLERRLFRVFLPLPPLTLPYRVWLRMPPFPQDSLSVLPTSPADTPMDSLFTSESFSSAPPSALAAAEEGWENRAPPHLLALFGLTSVQRSSAEDESLPPSLPFPPYHFKALIFRFIWVDPSFYCPDSSASIRSTGPETDNC